MIDWSRVAELRDEIGSASFNEVVDIFLTETGAGVSRICNCDDRSYLAAELHLLKGGVLTLGFSEVAMLCQTGEALARDGLSDQIDLAALAQAYDRACDMLLTQLSQRLLAG